MDIERILQSNGWSLCEFLSIPVLAMSDITPMSNSLITYELNYNREALRIEVNTLLESMTQE